MAILLTATTPFPDLLHALRHLRVPPVLVAIIAFMYRYLFVLADEAERLLRARAARSAGLPGGGGRRVDRLAGARRRHMAGQLFLRSYERSDRVYQRDAGARLSRPAADADAARSCRPTDWVALAGSYGALRGTAGDRASNL